MDTRAQSVKKEATEILGDLMDAHSLANTNLAWVSAIFQSIELAHQNKNPYLVKNLAELGRYFSDDWAGKHAAMADEIDLT